VAYGVVTVNGFEDPLIVASNELNEDLIADLKRQGAPINSWGVGTHLITSSDHPALGGVYKLVAVQSEAGDLWEPRIKLSSNPMKMTDPGRKQLVRYSDSSGRFLADIIRLADETSDGRARAGAGFGSADGERSETEGPRPLHFVERHNVSYLRGVEGWSACEQLLQVVMRQGVRVAPSPSLEAVRERARRQIVALPEEVRRLRNPEYYTVGLSPALAAERLRLAGQAPGVIAPGPTPAAPPPEINRS
jgi:nicotinate phosphoribosyltransferase